MKAKFPEGVPGRVCRSKLPLEVAEPSYCGTPTLDTSFTATVGAPDSFGRGTINSVVGTEFASTVNYYIVNAKCVRMVVVDPSASFVGSAYSQGTGTFSDSSIVQSVFSALSGSWADPLYSVAGMFTPNPDPAARPASLKPEGGLPELTFVGVADEDENGAVINAADIDGHWGIGSNGYGFLAVTSENLGDVTNFGVYMTDPTLNLSDPNNTTSGTGGALLAEMDTLVGTGFITPQTDTKTSSFTGMYGLGAQEFNTLGEVGWEFDWLGQGTLTSFAFGSSSTGLINDAWATLSSTLKSPMAISGTATPDATNVGRCTFSDEGALSIAYGGNTFPFTVTLYQAYGGYLASIETDDFGMWGGPFEQLTTATPADKPAEHLMAIFHH